MILLCCTKNMFDIDMGFLLSFKLDRNYILQTGNVFSNRGIKVLWQPIFDARSDLETETEATKATEQLPIACTLKHTYYTDVQPPLMAYL